MVVKVDVIAIFATGNRCGIPFIFLAGNVKSVVGTIYIAGIGTCPT